MRNFVTKKMNLIRGAIALDINNTFGKGPKASIEAHTIATTALNNTFSFVTQLLVLECLLERTTDRPSSPRRSHNCGTIAETTTTTTTR